MSRPATFVAFISGALLGVIGIAGTPLLIAQRASLPGSQSRVLLKTELTGCSGKEVSIAVSELSPGTASKHYHPGDSFTFILEGSEVYQIEGKPPRVVNTGDVLHEEPMQVHTVENAKPVRLLVVRVLEKGQPDTVWITPRP